MLWMITEAYWLVTKRCVLDKELEFGIAFLLIDQPEEVAVYTGEGLFCEYAINFLCKQAGYRPAYTSPVHSSIHPIGRGVSY